MSAGRIALLAIGVLLALTSIGLLVGGAGLLWADSVGRDADGALTSPRFELRTEHRAITAEELDLAPGPGDWAGWVDGVEVQLDVTRLDGEPVFVGVAPRSEVDRYLDDVAHAEITRLGRRGNDGVRYREVEGARAPEPPESVAWAASAAGPGTQQLTWLPEPGTWAFVVLNADGTPGVEVAARAAVEADFLGPLGLGLLAAGIFLLVVAVAMIVAGAMGASRPPTAPTAGDDGRHDGAVVPAGATAASAAAPSYPVVLTGRLDPPVSRWLWLVKWVLLIPHVVVLAFLWMAFAVLTLVAGVAILFTGRYPPGIFSFNVGVIRWTWRVVFYGYGALGTDRYPPFSLQADDGPATFDVAYPERLSRGLVLVKWWLLALPHYLIVGLLVGGGLAWTLDRDGGGWLLGGGGGIIGLLVFVAGLVLLFSGRYPEGLFDLVMGLNRWVYRVLAYAALMTDEYPPFRLDLGGPEPRPGPATPPSAGGPPQEQAPPSELVPS